MKLGSLVVGCFCVIRLVQCSSLRKSESRRFIDTMLMPYQDLIDLGAYFSSHEGGSASNSGSEPGHNPNYLSSEVNSNTLSPIQFLLTTKYLANLQTSDVYDNTEGLSNGKCIGVDFSNFGPNLHGGICFASCPSSVLTKIAEAKYNVGCHENKYCCIFESSVLRGTACREGSRLGACVPLGNCPSNSTSGCGEGQECCYSDDY